MNNPPSFQCNLEKKSPIIITCFAKDQSEVKKDIIPDQKTSSHRYKNI